MFRAQRGYQKLVAVGVGCSLLLLSVALGEAQTATNGVNVTQPIGSRGANHEQVAGGDASAGQNSGNLVCNFVRPFTDGTDCNRLGVDAQGRH